MDSQVCHWKKEDIIRSAETSTKYHLDSAFLEMMTLRLIIVSLFFSHNHSFECDQSRNYDLSSYHLKFVVSAVSSALTLDTREKQTLSLISCRVSSHP